MSTRFQGLISLIEKAGFTVTPGKNADDEPTIAPEGEGDGSGDDDDENGQDGGEGGGTPEGDGAGEGGEGEGEGGEGAGEGAGASANLTPAQISAAEQRGYDRANARWAAVMLSASARSNINLALDLLAESNMSPDAIIRTCKNNAAAGGAGSMRNRLQTQPAPGTRIGANQSDEGGDEDPAKSSRKSAAATVNQRTAARANGAPVHSGEGKRVESK